MEELPRSVRESVVEVQIEEASDKICLARRARARDALIVTQCDKRMDFVRNQFQSSHTKGSIAKSAEQTHRAFFAANSLFVY